MMGLFVLKDRIYILGPSPVVPSLRTSQLPDLGRASGSPLLSSPEASYDLKSYSNIKVDMEAPLTLICCSSHDEMEYSRY